jgi:dihydropteroate synthase
MSGKGDLAPMNGGEDIRWRVRDRLVRPQWPLVMGIINATPDSFHAPSRNAAVDDALRTAERMIGEGAGILDVGGVSTRPGAPSVDEADELARVLPVVEAIHRRFPEAWLSIDTFRSRVAREAVRAGAGMVNDVDAGRSDPAMLATVAELHVPYVAMHRQGTPATMQVDPQYADVAAEVTLFLSQRLAAAHAAGIPDVIIDPGFGFGKTTEHNFSLLHELPRLKALGVPVLVGLSRKRMINVTLGIKADAALNGTSVLNTIALLQGAHILRVHDVREAVEAVRLVSAFRG